MSGKDLLRASAQQGDRETAGAQQGDGETASDLRSAGIKTAVLFTQTDPGTTSPAVGVAAAAAIAAGCVLKATSEELAKHGEAAGALEAVAELPVRPDLCLALGGDGTILRALRHYAGAGVPVFGVNFGTIGFLATVEREQLQEGLERAFAGDFNVMALPGLHVRSGHESRVALNDVSSTRRPHGRVAELAYRLDSQEVGHVRCDGLVAATPAGSTGYNLANGGPILAWGVEGYVVSFIAPHTLTARSLVVAPDDVLYVRNAANREAVHVACDGEHVFDLEPGEEVSVDFSNAVGALAQLPGSSFYQRIREKFGRLA